MHGDNGLAIQRVAKGSERHNLVQPLAELLMRRVLRDSHAQAQANYITHIHVLAVQKVHIVVVGQVLSARATAAKVKNKQRSKQTGNDATRRCRNLCSKRKAIASSTRANTLLSCTVTLRLLPTLTCTLESLGRI